MFLETLDLKNFRNYQSLHLDLAPRLNIFVGPNGQGKTNVVEAVAIALTGKSFRPGPIDSVIQFDAQVTRIKSAVRRSMGKNSIDFLIGPNRKTLLLDQKHTSTAKLRALFPMVVFCPDSLEFVKDGPEVRRSLIDDFIQTHIPLESSIVDEFRSALRQRNHLLRQIQEVASPDSHLRVLDALDQLYLEKAANLAWSRIRALKVIQPLIQAAVTDITEGTVSELRIDYRISGESMNEAQIEVLRDRIASRADELRAAEIQQGTSLIGPHKHEIAFLSSGKDTRYFLSQGQQRALILGFKMAQIMYHRGTFGIEPILILDDVFSEFDPAKATRLLSFLEGIQSQIMMTTTDLAFPFQIEPGQSAVFRVHQGTVTRL